MFLPASLIFFPKAHNTFCKLCKPGYRAAYYVYVRRAFAPSWDQGTIAGKKETMQSMPIIEEQGDLAIAGIICHGA